MPHFLKNFENKQCSKQRTILICKDAKVVGFLIFFFEGYPAFVLLRFELYPATLSWLEWLHLPSATRMQGNATFPFSPL